MDPEAVESSLAQNPVQHLGRHPKHPPMPVAILRPFVWQDHGLRDLHLQRSLIRCEAGRPGRALAPRDAARGRCGCVRRPRRAKQQHDERWGTLPRGKNVVRTDVSSSPRGFHQNQPVGPAGGVENSGGCSDLLGSADATDINMVATDDGLIGIKLRPAPSFRSGPLILTAS